MSSEPENRPDLDDESDFEDDEPRFEAGEPQSAADDETYGVGADDDDPDLADDDGEDDEEPELDDNDLYGVHDDEVDEEDEAGRGGRRGENLYEDEPTRRPPPRAQRQPPRPSAPRAAADDETTAAPRRERTPPERDGNCLIIGPSQVGKTTLLAALQRACHLPGQDDYKLEFVAEGNTSSRLTRKIVDIITELKAGPNATGPESLEQRETDYPFMIHATTQGGGVMRRPERTSVRVVAHDGPGGAFFPRGGEAHSPEYERWRSRLAEDGRTAGSMILCVDSTEPEANLLEAYLGELIYDMSNLDTINEKEPLEQRLYRWVRKRPARPYRPYKRRCLNVKRFLLLLTKIDLLCAGMGSYDKSLKPARFAGMIDPIEQSRQLLGEHLLNKIRDALHPRASFAVGITSAWGFHPVSGEPFAGPDGRPGAAEGERGVEVLPYWRPFGVRDAIFYIATGKCRGTVSEVGPQHLGVRDDLEPLEVEFQSN